MGYYRYDLTERQSMIYDFLCDYLNKKGYPPTVREVGANVGLSSPSSVLSQFQKLEEKGYIRRAPGCPRAIEIM